MKFKSNDEMCEWLASVGWHSRNDAQWTRVQPLFDYIATLRAALELYAAIENWQETAVTEQLTGNVNSDGDEEEVEVELYLGEPLVWEYQGLAGPHLAQVALSMRNADDYWTSYEVSGRITR